MHRAAELLEQTRDGKPVTEILEAAVLDDHSLFPSALPVRREVSYNAWVTIQIGCDNTCAYCIVPAVRGKEISRPAAEIVAEVESLARSGVTQISLIGQNVNSYGRDLALSARAAGDTIAKAKPQFADLLRKVGAVPGISRVRFISPHPKDMREDTLAAMAETRAVVEHLHYPLQSGSDGVLASMHRGYTAERYLKRLAQAREMIDDLAVTTDVIVGFPGETEQDFLQTVEVCAEACFDSAFS
ncbi:MAG: radical SAM protein, partial [Actinomycetota bacterium]